MDTYNGSGANNHVAYLHTPTPIDLAPPPLGRGLSFFNYIDSPLGWDLQKNKDSLMGGRRVRWEEWG